MKKIITLCALLSSMTLTTIAFSEPRSIGESRTLNSKILGKEKSIQVYLPAETGHPDQKFPVLYLLHGQWDMLPAVATLDLIATTVPEFMVVGIDSRGPELNVSDGADTFARFLQLELFPLIEEEYPAADYRILSGHSHAGKFVMHQWLMDALPLTQYFAFSPSLDDGYLLDKIQRLPNAKDIQLKPLTLTMASEGEHMYTPYTKIESLLKGNSGFLFSSSHFPEESHRSTKHPSLKFALQESFPEWAPSGPVKMSGAAGIKKHYDTLSNRYGLSALPSIEMLQQITARYSVGGSPESHAKLQPMFHYALRDLNVSAAPFVEIVDYLTENGYTEASSIYLAALCRTEDSIDRCRTMPPNQQRKNIE
ncbi:alpha/beta hydrolase-fold protein [uncultured Microbulbifer sp.]|uniref:alpha/beta hydrolase n=1 Tax=uncultured Microbulbifer sp. TaxID=348147 RepID=UPI002625E332|nr:alpha/beta hydrolase-fold protein [uncultured Microbulbifer sp.]